MQVAQNFCNKQKIENKNWPLGLVEEEKNVKIRLQLQLFMFVVAPAVVVVVAAKYPCELHKQTEKLLQQHPQCPFAGQSDNLLVKRAAWQLWQLATLAFGN